VGRERHATEKEGKEHHPMFLWWFGNALVAKIMTGAASGRKPSFLAYFRSASSKDEGTQLRAILLVPLLTIFTLCATLLMGMQRWSARGLRGEGKCKEEEVVAAAEE
jgi:hypothetical protein